MPLQCPTLNGIGITHILTPSKSPYFVQYGYICRCPCSDCWHGDITRLCEYFCEYQKDLNFVTFSFHGIQRLFYPVREKKKACCRSDFKPLWIFPLSLSNDTAVFFSGEITFLKVIDLHSNPILYDIMTYKISACNPSKYCKNYSSRSQFELWKFLQKLFFLFLLCGCQQVCSPCKLVVDVC